LAITDSSPSAQSIPPLADAIEALYRTFSHYDASAFSGCPCCTSDEHSRYLAGQPLRDIEPSELSRYAFKALTTWGTVEDFKHFLPRVFEVIIDPAAHRIDLAIQFGKLTYGDWNNWPDNERHAIWIFFRTLWRELLANYPYVLDADDCLCGIGNAVDDMTPFLEDWDADRSIPAAQNLADFLFANSGSHQNLNKPAKLASLFWKSRPAQAAQVLQWLAAPQRSAYLETVFFQTTDSEIQQRLSDAQGYHATIQIRYRASSRANAE
jgi:hypothetical protein